MRYVNCYSQAPISTIISPDVVWRVIFFVGKNCHKSIMLAFGGGLCSLSTSSCVMCSMFPMIKCSVIYFTFIIVLCVLTLTTTMCVISLDARGDEVPVVAMPAWVCTFLSCIAALMFIILTWPDCPPPPALDPPVETIKGLAFWQQSICRIYMTLYRHYSQL